MKTLLLLLSSIVSITLYGQQFSFDMYFSDAIGNRDTITLGYDLTASESIDTAFGEVNIIDIPLDTAFDVRISDEWKNRTWYNVDGTYNTKKQILLNNCLNFTQLYIQTIDIYTKHWPVTVTWNNSLFNDICRMGSLFTSINPGGWWDTGSPSNLDQQILSTKNTVTFSTNISPRFNENYGYIKVLDTIPVFWLAIGPDGIQYSSIDETDDSQNNFKIYPNPAKTYFWVENPELDILQIEVIDLYGRSVLKQETNKNDYTVKVSINDVVNGMYMVRIHSDKKSLTKPLIVAN